MLDYMKDLALAQSIDAVWDLHCAAMAEFGFDRVIYGMTRATGANGTLGEFDDALVLSNHAQSYDDTFIASQMFLEAPGFRWARDNVGAISWGALWTESQTLTPRGREIIAFQRMKEVCAGYTISFPKSPARTFAVVSLTGSPHLSQRDLDALWETEGCRIWTMNNVMHLKVLSLPHRNYTYVLSSRQREALEWVGDGKSYQDIATIMGVSMATVEKHLRLAREKLRVATTSQAVLKAAFQNQIYATVDSGLSYSDRTRGAANTPCSPGPQRLTKT